jgi:hypothetical protein
MNSIYMNHYVNIMEDLDGKSDIGTDEELLLFSETEWMILLKMLK